MDLATKLLEEQMGVTEQLPLPLDEKKQARAPPPGAVAFMFDI